MSTTLKLICFIARFIVRHDAVHESAIANSNVPSWYRFLWRSIYVCANVIDAERPGSNTGRTTNPPVHSNSFQQPRRRCTVLGLVLLMVAERRTIQQAYAHKAVEEEFAVVTASQAHTAPTLPLSRPLLQLVAIEWDHRKLGIGTILSQASMIVFSHSRTGESQPCLWTTH